MSVMFFLCGVARVAIPVAFTTVAFVDAATGIVLAVPFGLLVVAVALYDARERHRRRDR